MRPLQKIPWIAAALALVAGGALANVGASKPAPLAEGPVPVQCQRWLEVPAPTTSETVPWEQRLSYAACRQSFWTNPTSDPAEFASMVAQINREMEPSAVMYRDAMDNGATPQVRILGAYNLGMTYVDTIVRARSAVRVSGAGGGSFGGASYGATLDRYQILSRALEPLLAQYRDAAFAAFGNVLRLAEENPDAANANSVMTYVVADARWQHALFRTESGTPTTATR